MTKKAIVHLFIAGLLGLLVGLAAMLIAYPFIFPPPILNEKLVNAETKTLVAKGHFIHPNPKDFIHYGQGSVSVYKDKHQYEIMLSKDFKVGPGPAFHVFLSETNTIKTNAAFKDSKKYDLGMLTSESLCSRKILAVVSPKFVHITRLILGPDSSGVRHALAHSGLRAVATTMT